MKQFLKLTLYIVPMLLCLLTSQSRAGVTGKVSGIILDTEYGEPGVGATVWVLGTSIATQTDIDGEYFIINIPSGKYDISVTSVGFETITKLNVRVLVDLTTPVDFDVNEKTIEISSSVEVFADNPIIQKDLTASKVIFTSDRLRQLPNIVSVQSILTNYPGVVIGRDEGLHVRGGRSGQVSFYFDGFSVQDPFVSNSGIRIMPNALEELSLTSGGYTAEYGEALSGVVSAITREGSADYRGLIKLYEGLTHSYDVNNGDWGTLDRNGNKSASLLFSGPLPYMNKKSNNFSFAGEYLHDPTSLPHNGYVSYTGTAKFSIQPTPKLRLISNLTYFQSEGEVYDHRDVNGVSYDLNLDGLPVFKKDSRLLGLSGNYHLNEKMIITARFNHFYTFTKTAPDHLFDTYWDQWDGYSEDSNGVYDGTIQDSNYTRARDLSTSEGVTGFTTGNNYDPTFRRRESQYNALHMSVLNQVTKSHQLKAGFEYRAYEIDWDFKQFFNDQPYGEKYDSKPKYYSMFFQDKIEYDFYVMNIGLRYDYRNDNISYRSYSSADDLVGTIKEAKSNSNISPRFGVSFPITDNSVMHFNYGVYYQVPKFTYLYTNLQGDIGSGFPLLGNPNLKPERTTSYEIGINELLTDDLRVNMTFYQKDINDLVTTRELLSDNLTAGKSGADTLTITTFQNQDYGSAKGIDIQIEKLSGTGLLSASISYGYMIANGNGSSAYDPYYSFITSTTDTLAPVSEFPLDFDQRHTLTAVLDFRVPNNYKEKLFGLQIPTNWGVGFVGNYGAGLPYTITDSVGNRVGERNSGRLPSNMTVDMKFLKHFDMNNSKYKLSFFLEVDNLFDKRNIVDVYTNTGRPDYDGFTSQETLSTGVEQTELNDLDVLFDKDPTHYSKPRTVRAGFEFNF